jgi:hypothetical protein
MNRFSPRNSDRRKLVVWTLASMTSFGGFSFDESPFAGIDLLSSRCVGQTRQQPPNTGRPGTPQPNNPGANRGNTGNPRSNPGTQRPAGQGPAGAAAKNPPAPAPKKVSEEDKRKERARALFADAANAQNNGAYPLAMDPRLQQRCCNVPQSS